MLIIAVVPLVLFAVICLIMLLVPVAVEIAEQRRVLRVAARITRRFRPVVIEGGRTQAAPVVAEDETQAPESRIA